MYLLVSCTALLLDSEDGGSALLRNSCELKSICTTLQREDILLFRYFASYSFSHLFLKKSQHCVIVLVFTVGFNV
jgi:hypothetical protein